MCGFIGSASVKNYVDQKWLINASLIIKHRGPDDYSHWISKNRKVGLAHRRLSIIDLSEKARQPFFYYQDKLGIVFNGEIYNFMTLKKELEKEGLKFHSNSDTEVLLNSYKCWGYGCLNKINGMFSFVIYDGYKNKIFGARDIAGQKPFYYSMVNKTFLFGSDLQTISSNPIIRKRICMKSLDYYLSRGYTPLQKTLIKGVSKLPPGNAISYDLENGDLKIWKYWNLPKRDLNLNFSNKSIINSLEEKLENAVTSQLISDVPIGICLSGGLDSSLITALASRNLKNISTFTAIFPSDQKYDESKHANLIANHFSTNHHEIRINNPSIDIFNQIKDFFDEPLADSSTISTFLLFSELSKICKVALGGDGSDELFGGYSHHHNKDAFLIKYFPSLISEKIYKHIFDKLPIGLKGRNYLLNFYLHNKNLIPPYPYLFDYRSRKNLLSKQINSEPRVNEDCCISCINQINFSEYAIRNDFENYLSNDILVKSDRTSMANSLELRSPFLDKSIIEFCYKYIPIQEKVNRNSRKIILKKLAKSILPDNFQIDRKQGFSVPFSKWIRSGIFRDFVFDKLLGSDEFFNKKYIKRLIRNQDRGFSNSERIYSLLVFELWREKIGL